jgi:hypothetical protein
LAGGLALLAAGGYFAGSAIEGWKPLWQRAVAPAQRKAAAPEVTSSLRADPDTAGARIQVYGLLAKSAAAQKSAQALSADDAGPDAAADASPQSARPTGTPFIEPVNRTPAAGPNHFLHGKFSLRGYRGYAFEVPSHAIHPVLHGKYQSIAAGGAGPEIEVMLMSDSEFDELAHGQPGTTTIAADPASSGQMDWVLTSSVSAPQKYYLVFHNPARNVRSTLVSADFTLTSE